MSEPDKILKEQIRQRFVERSQEWDGPKAGMSIPQWHQAWVNVMLDVAAEVLAETVEKSNRKP
jgi:hypothetical protein